VLDPAKSSNTTRNPKPVLFSLVAIVLGGFFSTFIAFFFEYLESLGVKVSDNGYVKGITWINLKK